MDQNRVFLGQSTVIRLCLPVDPLIMLPHIKDDKNNLNDRRYTCLLYTSSKRFSIVSHAAQAPALLLNQAHINFLQTLCFFHNIVTRTAYNLSLIHIFFSEAPAARKEIPVYT